MHPTDKTICWATWDSGWPCWRREEWKVSFPSETFGTPSSPSPLPVKVLALQNHQKAPLVNSHWKGIYWQDLGRFWAYGRPENGTQNRGRNSRRLSWLEREPKSGPGIVWVGCHCCHQHWRGLDSGRHPWHSCHCHSCCSFYLKLPSASLCHLLQIQSPSDSMQQNLVPKSLHVQSWYSPIHCHCHLHRHQKSVLSL